MKKILTFALVFLLGLTAYFLFQNKSKNEVVQNKIIEKTTKNATDKSASHQNISSKNKQNKKNDDKIAPISLIKNDKIKPITAKPSFKLNRIHTWAMLKIKPLATPEGIYYTFSGFDVVNNSTACIVGKFNNVNLLKITIDDQVSDIKLPAPPMDVKVYKNNIYVLTTKGISIIENKSIKQNITINDPQLAYFDKFLVFDQKLYLLMSDGSAYQINKNQLTKQKVLKTNQQEIWIQKTDKNSFELKASPCQKICQKVTYTNEIGSITLSGGNSDNIFVCVDKYSSTRPAKIKRVITSSQSKFKKELLNLPVNSFTYIKNDYKIANNKIYYVKVNEKGFRIIQKKL